MTDTRSMTDAPLTTDTQLTADTQLTTDAQSMTDIRSRTLKELSDLLGGMGEKAFRAKQLFDWFHVKNAMAYAEMTNLPASLRETLADRYPIEGFRMETVQVSKLDGTRKYLFAMADGECIESVFMVYHHGNTVCISSQAGCRMGCRFCASTLNGLARNLTAGEMLAQIYAIERDTGERVSNVVVMGCGEPLDNYDQLVRFIHLLTDEKGHHISERNITVSTCGLVPQIYAFAKEGLSVNLALSLHAPNDERRRELMPIAKKYSLDEVLPAMRAYYESNHRRLTFEYALVAGVNDSEACAEELAARIRGMNAFVNLIPVNPVRERGLMEPTARAVLAFKKKLEKLGINVTIRRELGRDIDGACGQLRKRVAEAKSV